ncbi:MAG: hypothetical protein AAB436_03605 [Patescibacteria group bacterium]
MTERTLPDNSILVGKHGGNRVIAFKFPLTKEQINGLPKQVNDHSADLIEPVFDRTHKEDGSQTILFEASLFGVHPNGVDMHFLTYAREVAQHVGAASSTVEAEAMIRRVPRVQHGSLFEQHVTMQ